MTVNHITGLLRYVLNSTDFQYNNEFYAQVEGAAIGQPVSPIIAEFFMEDFEKKALSSYPNPPRFWGRYVDDTFVIIKKSEVTAFTNHINSLHPSIKFTMEREDDGQLAMLDVLVKRAPNGSLKFQVYRKSTHTNQYLSFSSHHPLQHKLGVVRALVDRANTIVTTEDDKKEEITGIRKSLAICGYRKWAWDTANNRINSNRRSSRNKNTDHPNKGSVTLPYAEGVTESLQRLFKSHHITTHIKPQNSLRSLLVSPKDPTHKLDKSGAVYGLQCADCDSTYVGESARPLRNRLKEHERPSSPVGERAMRAKHRIDWDNVRVLDRESDWYRRGVREAIHIKRRDCNLNRDQGRHILPLSYDNIIKSCDPRNTSGHVTTTE
ncbi:uncharacterized protein [Amphiura filiformis]|uniref:uncharacterized protein n=1 Tax=Amphiura filiformis TaxID=82378 RepID=UPI003B2133D6